MLESTKSEGEKNVLKMVAGQAT
ncbi:MAG: hypothetical protein ACD_62C00626G0007, partial [uncultured bacterium]